MSDVAFDFTESFQEAIIGYAITDPDFFKTAAKKLKPTYFSADPKLSTIFSQLINVYENYGSPAVSTEELKNQTYFRELKSSEKINYYNTIDRCVGVSLYKYDLKKMKEDLTGFLRMSIFKEVLSSGASQYKNSKNDPNKLESTYVWTNNKLSEIKEATFVNESKIDKIGDVLSWLNRREKLMTDAISTGSAALDKLLGGGLFKQDNSAIMAPTNTGKSRALFTIARHAIRQGCKVLVITHEDVPDKIKEQFLLGFLGISKDTMRKWVGDKDKEAIIVGASQVIDKYLYFMPFNKAGQMFVEDVIDEARRVNEDIKSKNGGRGFDLIIDDYPKKLKMRSRIGNRDNLMRAELAEIYDHFVQLAIELDCHVMVAIQTNRAGLKKSKMIGDDKSGLGLEDTDEAFGIAQNIANVIALMRTPQDKDRKILRLSVIKSRNGTTDEPLFSRSAYAANILFGDFKYIDNGGKWDTDIFKNCLISYAPGMDNANEGSETIDNQLKIMEEGFNPKKHENGNDVSIGVYKTP